MTAKNETITNVIESNTTVKEASTYLSDLAANVHEHLRAVDRDTRTILATMVAFVKAMLKNPTDIAEFLALAKARSIAFPFTVDDSGELVPTDSSFSGNIWLYMTRVLIGKADEAGKWVPDEYFVKNLPGAARELATFEDEDVSGLLNVIETVKAKKGKKTVGGIQALVLRDRAKHATPRGSKNDRDDLPVSVPAGVVRAKPVATVKLTDRALFPVDDDGYCVCFAKIDEATDEMHIYFGAADTGDVARIGATGWEKHKEKIERRSVRVVDLTPASVQGKVAA